MKAPRIATSNPKLKLVEDLNASPNPPSVNFHMADGSDVSSVEHLTALKYWLDPKSCWFQIFFDSKNFKIEEMMFAFHLKAQEVDMKYSEEGKNVEDEEW